MNNHTIYSFNRKSIELLDSSHWVEIPLPQFPLAPESESITFSDNNRQVPITIQSTSSHPALVSLSLSDNIEYPAKYISISPKTREIEPYGKTVFYLQYDNKINETNSYDFNKSKCILQKHRSIGNTSFIGYSQSRFSSYSPGFA